MATSLTTFEVQPAISTLAEAVATLSSTEEVMAHLAMVARPTTMAMLSPTSMLRRLTKSQHMRTPGERNGPTVSKN